MTDNQNTAKLSSSNKGTETLLPCPFCGGPAEAIEYSDEELGKVWQVFCVYSTCETQPLREGLDNKEECIKYWNTRAEAQQPVDGELVKTLKQARLCIETSAEEDRMAKDTINKIDSILSKHNAKVQK